MSILIHGPRIPIEEIIQKLKQEIEQHNLKVVGPLYLISMVGPQLGLDIPPKRYLARIMLPIELKHESK